MSKSLEFRVRVYFSDEISTDDDIHQVAQNIARAIKSEVNSGEGIAPDESGAYTRAVEVKPQFQDGAVYLETV